MGSADGLKLLRRTDEVWKQYQLQQAEQTKKYTNYSAFIRSKFLGFEEIQVRNEQGEVRLAAISFSDDYRCEQFALNDFPCHLESGIAHYCMWSTHELEKDEIEDRIAYEFPD